MPAKKKPAANKSVVRKSAVPISSSKSRSLKYQNLITKRNIIVAAVLLVLILGALLYVFRGMFIAATVNGQVITRMQLTSELEKKSGKATLENLITKNLILSEMKKENITVSDEEVSSELKKIQTALSQQGRTLDDALSQQGLTKQDLEDQVKIQKMIEKLFAKEATVSSKEVDAYLEQNKDSLPQGQSEKTLRSSAEAQIKQQKLTAKFQAWLAALQKKAKVQYFVNF